jgi:SAM-dependent methyltransferase
LASPEIFDAQLIRANLERAANALPGADFLIRHAVEEIASRLPAVKRDFGLAADISAISGDLAALLKQHAPALKVISLSPALGLASRCESPRAVASQEALPLKEGTFGLITSVLSLHLVNDLPGALVQIRRALMPDGFFMAALLGGDSLIELREAFMLAETETAGGLSPRVFPTADLRDMGALLQRAGFALPVADTETLNVTYAGPIAMMRELKAMGASNPLHARSRKLLRRDTFARACQIYAERFGEPDGRVRATFEIFYIAGWAPHESQQKPLKPGSAQARLADALKTVEVPAGDKANFPRKPA